MTTLADLVEDDLGYEVNYRAAETPVRLRTYVARKDVSSSERWAGRARFERRRAPAGAAGGFHRRKQKHV